MFGKPTVIAPGNSQRLQTEMRRPAKIVCRDAGTKPDAAFSGTVQLARFPFVAKLFASGKLYAKIMPMKRNWFFVLIGKAGGVALFCWLAFATQADAALLPAGHLPGGVIWASNQVGVVGGIPTVTTIYTNLSPDPRGGTNDWYNINVALIQCPSNEVVYLNAGTYNLSDYVYFGTTSQYKFPWWWPNGNSGVVLRGAGTGKTIINCYGAEGFVVGGVNANAWSMGPPTNMACAWLSGYPQGSTNISIDPNTRGFGLLVGDLIMLTQENDTNLVDNTGNTSSQVIFTDIYGKLCNQIQWVKVTSVDTTGTNLTIWPGVYMTNYQASLHPQLIVYSHSGDARMCGIEDMTLNPGVVHGGDAIAFQNTYNCWVRNVEVTNSWYSAVHFLYSAHGTMEDCYIHDTASGGATVSYGVNPCTSSDVLVENNIFYKITAPVLIDAGSSGCVAGYNYMTNMLFEQSPGCMMACVVTHGAHPSMNLVEGNMGTEVEFDFVHGSSSHNTVFRNDFYGYETNLNNYGGGFYMNYDMAVTIQVMNRWMTFVGNVLGTPSYSTLYESSPIVTPGANVHGAVVFNLGYFDSNDTNNPDPLTVTSLTRDGNYDYATMTATNWTDTPQTIPTSLYLTSKPAWWSNSVPWPSIGSDLTPMVGTIPAQLRFAAMTAPTDPPPSQGSVPAPPSVLKVMGQ